MLLRFLTNHVGRYPLLRHLIIEILEHCNMLKESFELLSESSRNSGCCTDPGSRIQLLAKIP